MDLFLYLKKKTKGCIYLKTVTLGCMVDLYLMLVSFVCCEQETMEKNKLDHAEEIQRVQKDHTVQLEVNFWMRVCDDKNTFVVR